MLSLSFSFCLSISLSSQTVLSSSFPPFPVLFLSSTLLLLLLISRMTPSCRRKLRSGKRNRPSGNRSKGKNEVKELKAGLGVCEGV
jgi:hypothetical protein